MALKRYVTEMGMGTDVHGGDYTKAARRAVSDAIRHSSLNFFRVLDRSPEEMRITVRIGVQEPDQLDTEAIAAELPYGEVNVVAVKGGLDVPEEDGIDKLVSLIRTYFRLDGHHVQFNVIDADTLRRAQEKPEEHRNLIVRVAGYSDYFVDVGRTLQDEIISRTAHEAV